MTLRLEESHSPLDLERAKRTVDLALRCLVRVRQTGSVERVRDLSERAERLRDEIALWAVRPPTSEARESLVRSALSIQVAALALARR
jgi:hypothetical protein